MSDNFLVSKWGYNPDVDAFTGADEDVISSGGLQYWAATAAVLQISAGSANDTEGGTGANSIRIEGLDENWLPIFEEVDLNGVSVVNTVQKFIRVNRAYVTKSGSLEANDTDITIGDGTGTHTIIEAGVGQTEKATYSVPSGVDNAYISEVTVAIQVKTSTNATAKVFTREFGSNTWRTRAREVVSDDAPLSENVHIGLTEKTDIRLTVTAASADNLPIKGGFNIRKY